MGLIYSIVASKLTWNTNSLCEVAQSRCLWKHVFNQQCKSQSFIRVVLHSAGEYRYGLCDTEEVKDFGEGK